jgi:hypothetical protein
LNRETLTKTLNRSLIKAFLAQREPSLFPQAVFCQVSCLFETCEGQRALEERAPLATKLNFIEDCGITIFKSIIDTRLRNDIAHMNFDIDGDMVYIRGKPAIDMIVNSVNKMWTAFDVQTSLMKEAKSSLKPGNKTVQ